jgi:acetyl esterase/lipase
LLAVVFLTVAYWQVAEIDLPPSGQPGDAMKPLRLALLALPLLGGCGRQPSSAPGTGSPADVGGQADQQVSLPEARRGFQTRLARRESAGEPVPKPPPGPFRLVRYDAPPGKLAAYLSRPPQDGKRHPAILWITGGDCNTIDQSIWREGPPKNDQSASAFRKAGIVMLFPSLRGGNDNPGLKEGFFGEVDDVLAAADYLAGQDFVDTRRLYLGGHSTGGTLVFLAAASTDRFRAVFSFGPVEDVRGYPPVYLPFDPTNPREWELRSPRRWQHSVRSPLFVFEGTEQPGNIESLYDLARASRNPLVHCYPVNGANHFSILFPVTRLVARKILRDDGPTTNIAFTEDELAGLFSR